MKVLMKRLFIICVLMTIFTTPCVARDFIVEFLEENYKETQAQFSYDPLIYHSIQVNSGAGPKLLILTGSDYNYRKWLRRYIAQDKKFIAKISDDRMDEFISAKAYELDVTQLHPFNGDHWKKDDTNPVDSIAAKGTDFVLIVDPNEKRNRLVQNIVKKMGYQAISFKTGKQALEFFNLHPEKFKLVMTHHSALGILSDNFVHHILKINQTVPIVIDTGYKKSNLKQLYSSKFSGSGSVHIKPVILRDLQKTIELLANLNV